ncbi:MAG: PAS domain-containing protein [Anaerolineae bacterium]|nr:PAS domain-containing protein [Anaerolineae bacterium]
MGLAARDRTGERRLVEMFRAEREQRKAVVDASPVGVCAFDRAGNLAVSNATADDLLGVRLAPYLGRSFRRLLIDLMRLGALERIGLRPAAIRTLLDDLKRDPLEAVHRHFDPVVAGQRRHYQMSVFPLQGRAARARGGS